MANRQPSLKALPQFQATLHEFAGTVPTGSVASALPFVAVTVTVGLHLWRRHMLLSISVGTAAHVALATLFADA